MKTMTLEELAASKKPFFTPTDICGVVGCDPQTLRLMARQKPERLGFPSMVLGNRVKFPRIPFLEFMGVKGTDSHSNLAPDRG